MSNMDLRDASAIRTIRNQIIVHLKIGVDEMANWITLLSKQNSEDC